MSKIVRSNIISKAPKAVFTVFALLFSFLLHAQHSTHKWIVQNPFVHNVFIENKGQVVNGEQKGISEKILYYTHKGHIHLYFTANTLTFEYDSVYRTKESTATDADDDENIKVLPVFTSIHWDEANVNPQIEVQNPSDDYFTYSNPNDKSGHSSILTYGWRKIIYHNLYNNIDVAFYYSADKKGLEYDIIVHPGGDLSQVKMHYSDNAVVSLIDKQIHIFSPCANFTDRAPIARDETGNAVPIAFSLADAKGETENIVSFTAGNYDKSKTLTIDPLLSTTSFTGTNKAYDLQYDLAGNVYVMGGGDATENQLQKYNAAGALQWTYTCTYTYTSGGLYYYGGFTTDNRSGTSYIAEGLDYSGGGSVVVKINAAGSLVTTYPGNPNVEEMWRIAFDYCDNQLIIGAGAKGFSIQACTLDTNLTTINSVNVLGAGNTHHDMAMVAFDGVGKCYMATTRPANPIYTGFDNVLLQMPAATLAPTAYQVYDRSAFIETASQVYYPALVGGPYLYSGNGFNGLVADLNMVITYDGNKIRKWAPGTGAIVDSVTVTPTPYTWGGIAIDCEDNIYVGHVKSFSIYNSALGFISTSPLPDTVYDLKLSPFNILYGCGRDFISADVVTVPKMVTAASPSTSCGCTGTATATVCDNYPYTYSWSNGQTTQTATGLCPGKYLVTIKDAACIPRIDTASVIVSPGTGTLTATVTANNVKCNGQSNGTAIANPTGGTLPYTYLWNTGNTNASDTGLAAGSYTCVVKDAGGCTDTLKITITQPAALTLATTTFPATCSYLCNGQAIVVPTGGTNPYNYAWSNGGTGASINNLCVGTTYSITVTDLHGCTHDTTVTVANPPPIIVTTDSSAAICSKANGSAGIVTITGGTPGYTYLWNTGATTSALTNVVSDLYCVIITDANKCNDTVCVNVGYIPGDSAKVVAITNEICNGGNTGSATVSGMGGTGPYTYSWSPNVSTGATATNITAGTYTITVTDSNGCINWAYAHITEPPPVTVVAPDTMICIGQTATLTATGSGGTPGYTYLWNGTATGSTFTASPASTTTYNVQATDANGCTSPVVNVIVKVRNPLIVVCGPPTKMCLGGSVTLTATGGGGDSIYTFTWLPIGTTGPTVTVSPAVTTTYTVIIKDACGTPQAQDTVQVVIYPAPVVAFTADTLSGCYPHCVKFSDLSTVAGGSIASWSWNFGDGGTSYSQDTTYCYTKPGVYTVSLAVTTNNGCSGVMTIPNYITVYDHPHANFSASPQPTNMLNPTITFTDQSTDLYGIVSWDWTFGDGLDSLTGSQNAIHTYQDTGTFCPWLVVVNKHGCIDSIQKCVIVEPYWTIYVPNAFTPNANGLNDLFTAKGVGIVTYQMWIFDRWGMQIYHTTDLYGGWNGVVQNGASGQMAEEDTYVWLIEVTDVFHKDHKYIGRVTLAK